MIGSRVSAVLTAVALWTSLTTSSPLNLGTLGIPFERRADSSLVGYLGAFFLGADPYVYFYLSNGNNALSFKALNGGQPVIKPTKGTGGVRDPAIVQGGGSEAGKKWYIVGTDLNIAKVGCLAEISYHQAKTWTRQAGTPPSAMAHVAYLSGRAPTSSPGPMRGW